MRKKENFTADRVARLVCEEGKQQSIHWDGKTPGLGVRVTKSGSKSFIFETYLHGKTMRITIGDVRAWSISKAQAEATRFKTLTDQGIDPRQQQAELRVKANALQAEAKGKAALVLHVWEEYLDYQRDKMQRANIERGKKWGERHLLDHQRLAQKGGEPRKRGKGFVVAGVLRPLLDMRIVDISVDVLRDWLRNESETRANNARQGYEAFRAFWRWCADRPELKNIIDAAIVESKELRDEVPARKSKEADALEREQLAAWFAAARGLSSPTISAYLQILLLTGARREEIASMKWKDVDFKWHALTIKDKVEGERVIPLTPYVASLLQELKRINETPSNVKRLNNSAGESKGWKPSQWVFASPTAADGKLTEPRLAHNRVLAVAGLPHVSLHGLRRTFASMAEWQAEMPSGVVAQIMGHKPSATAEKHYKRRPLDLLREWHTKYELWMLNEAGVEFKQESSKLRVVA